MSSYDTAKEQNPKLTTNSLRSWTIEDHPQQRLAGQTTGTAGAPLDSLHPAASLPHAAPSRGMHSPQPQPRSCVVCGIPCATRVELFGDPYCLLHAPRISCPPPLTRRHFEEATAPPAAPLVITPYVEDQIREVVRYELRAVLKGMVDDLRS